MSGKQFLEHATLNVFLKSATPIDTNGPNTYLKTPRELKRLVFRSTVNSEYGKRLRWHLETGLSVFTDNQTVTRNQVLNDDVSLIENKDAESTDILQDYFIPDRHFHSYINGLKRILPHESIDLLNITIRNVHRDGVSLLNYAQENVFGFVLLINQQKTKEAEELMEVLTRELVSLTLDHEGTFYLPYRLHIDRRTMRQAYPQADDFFRLKLKYDPEEVFRNKFYEHYK